MNPDIKDLKMPSAFVIGLDHVNGIQTARTLIRNGVPVVGVAKDRNHYCCRTRVCDRIIFTDTTGISLIETLEEVGPTLEQKSILYPCTDPHVLLVSRHRQRLQPWYHVVLPPHDVIEMLMDKMRFYSFAQENDLPIPRTLFLRNMADAEKAAGELTFPCILKPPISGLPQWEQKSKLKAYLLSDPAELKTVYQRYSPLSEVLILQEWVQGPVTNQYTCNCYFNNDSRCIATFISRKLRQWPPETGEGCLSEESRNDSVLRETVRLYEKVNYRGLGYVEMKQDERTGKLYILEPNVGRPTGRSAIAEAGGVELLYTMYCDAFGLPLPAGLEQKYGNVKWIYFRRDLQSALYYWRRGELTLREWRRSLRGPKVDALFAWTDPGPFIGDFLRAIRLFLNAEERKKRDYSTPF